MPPQLKKPFTLPPLTITRLKKLAFHIGAPLTARKPTMISSIERAMSTPLFPASVSTSAKIPPPPRVVISIDMGIRNFAICVVSSGDASPATIRKQQKSSVTDVRRPLWGSTARVLAWRKVDLMEMLSSLREESNPTITTTTSSSPPPPPRRNRKDPPVEANSIAEEPEVKPPVISDFRTADIPALAVKVVREIILPLCTSTTTSPVSISKILIEHQRHRSGSALGVLQTTLLVNALEVSLDAILRSLRVFLPPVDPTEESKSHKVTSSSSLLLPPPPPPPTLLMDPKKVSEFWIRDLSESLVAALTRNPGILRQRRRNISEEGKRLVKDPNVMDEYTLRRKAQTEAAAAAAAVAAVAAEPKKRGRKKASKPKPIDEIPLETDEINQEKEEEEEETALVTRTRLSAAKATKLAIKRGRIELLTSWLETSALILESPEAKAVGSLFIPPTPPPPTMVEEGSKGEVKKKRKSRRKAGEGEGEGEEKPEKKEKKVRKTQNDYSVTARAKKVDDLTDCVLQGLYALRVAENREAMKEWGVDVFLKEEEEGC